MKRMPPFFPENLLRKRDSFEDHRVAFVELFFDLVFVFTITQLTALVEEHLSLLGVVRAGLVFVVMYWMYSGYAWLTNQVPPATTDRRLLLVCGMAAFLICALAIPHAFDRTALAFSLGYVLVVLVHSGLYAQAHGATVWRFVSSGRRVEWGALNVPFERATPRIRPIGSPPARPRP